MDLHPRISFFDIKKIEISHKEKYLRLSFKSYRGDTGEVDLYFDLELKEPHFINGKEIKGLRDRIGHLDIMLSVPKCQKDSERGGPQINSKGQPPVKEHKG